jgi:hypothetical protein
VSNPVPYTLTQDSITVVWKGRPYTAQKGSQNFVALRKAVLEEKWDLVPNYLSVGKSIESWAKGNFKVLDDKIFYKGDSLPEGLNGRIMAMTQNGEDPTAIFNFWERLQKNPSWRSVEQLWPFLQHQIPLTPDGCFLAYKGVNNNYTDKHTNTVDNTPGTVHEMMRNKISDDPNEACHYGFHVGALSYASTFGEKTVICKVDPEHVVCVPYGASQQKMRVCKYEVVGNYGSPLPSTTYLGEPDVSPRDPDDEEDDSSDSVPDEDPDLENLDEEDASEGDKVGEGDSEEGDEESEEDASEDDEDDDEDDDEESEEEPEEAVDTTSTRQALPKGKGRALFPKFLKMDRGQLLTQSIEELRKHASHDLLILGASKIPGGKPALVASILKFRSGK